MSDAGDAPEVVVEQVEEPITDIFGAIRKVLKNAIVNDVVVRGLHEVAKVLDGGKAQVVFLAESCNEQTYKKLVQGLCAEHNVPLVDVPDNKSLGEWAGLCKIDKDGLPRKVVGASCVVITDFGEEGQAYNYLMNYPGKS